MDDCKKSRKPSRKPGTKRKQSAQPDRVCTDVPDKCSEAKIMGDPLLSGVLYDLKQEVSGSALHVATKAGGTSLKIGKALLLKPAKRKLFREAGFSLKDLRNLAGMPQNEVSHALKVIDPSLLKATEEWVATFTIDFVLRITGLYSRDELIPFIKKYARTYTPSIGKLLDDWGIIGRLHLYLEREVDFVNPYRHHVMFRKLSDEAFEKLSTFTRAAREKAPYSIPKKENSHTER